MPFRSKAQQRFMFATNPAKAKEWAKETKDIKSLPEKRHPQMNPEGKKLPGVKTASADGLFFEKRSQPEKGNFFRDMSGRDDGTFHEKSAQANYPQGVIPRGAGVNVSPPGAAMFGSGGGLGEAPPKVEKTEEVETSATGAPIGGSGQKGEGMGGGMYLGTGKGVKKQAARTPSDWDADSGLPTGFHRPAEEQPEALEAGGDRFHNSQTKGPDYGVGEGISHGLVEGGSLRVKGTSGGQIGKHASPRFLGTSYGLDKTAKSWGEERGSEFKRSLEKGVSGAGEAASEGVKSITRSPAASIVAAMLLAKMGLKGAKGAGRVAKKGYKRARFGKQEPEVPKSLAEKLMGGARSLGERLKVTT